MLSNVRRGVQVFFTLLQLWLQLHRMDECDRPVLLRRTFEKLSGTFVKLGQMLALRPDLLPPAYCYELFRLLDRVPPFPYQLVEEIIIADFGQSPETLFQYFEKEPLASASFGQVHRAITPDGEGVAVKVQRPGICHLVETDLQIVSILSWFLDKNSFSSSQKIKPMTDEFARLTRQELDYTIEARSNDLLYRTSQRNFKYKIPRTYWDYISSRVLTSEYLEGVPLSQFMKALYQNDRKALDHYRVCGIEHIAICRNLWDSIGEQVYLHGMFHADPHPANIIILENNVLGYVDFGIVGWMSLSLRTKLTGLVRASAEGNFERAADLFLEIVPPTPDTDLPKFQRTFVETTYKWSQIATDRRAPFRERSFSKLFAQQMQMVRTYNLQTNPEMLAYFRTVLAIDSITLQIAPEFDSNAHAQIFFRDLDRKVQHQIQQQLQSPEFIQRQILNYSELLQNLPYSLMNWLKTYEHPRRSQWEAARQQQVINTRTRMLSLSILCLSLALALNALATHQILVVILLGLLLSLGLWLLRSLRQL
jgi:ubiquinone biosynthesis protein